MEQITSYLPQLPIEELWYNIPYLCERCYTQHALNIWGGKYMLSKPSFLYTFTLLFFCIFLSYQEKMVSLHRIMISNLHVPPHVLIM